MNEQERFEKEARRVGLKTALSYTVDGKPVYAKPDTKAAWEIWQAAREQGVEPVAACDGQSVVCLVNGKQERLQFCQAEDGEYWWRDSECRLADPSHYSKWGIPMPDSAFKASITPQPAGDWVPKSDGPTSWELRFVEALRVLCGGVEPPDRMVKGWIAQESDELQGWVVSNCTFHWATGIAAIDAATALANDPEEGVGHEINPSQPPREQEGSGHE